MIVIGKEEKYLNVVTLDNNNWLGLESLKMYYEEEINTNEVDSLVFEDLMDYVYDDKIENHENINKDIIEILDNIIYKAVDSNSTDIHIESYQEEGRVRYRRKGLLEEVKILSLEKLSHLLTRIKLISNLDISEKRIPQDGRFRSSFCGREIDFRVSSFPVINGEKIVIRILDKNRFDFNIESLGFNDKELVKFKSLINKTSGMILLTGPSGSGKTTTLYTILNYLNSRNVNIMTIEDPVEYKFRGINQSQLNRKANYDFEEGLESILRQDPDIIMIGEIRNEQTAMLACKAAITGHLVLSTLHTIDSISAIDRLLSLGVNNHVLSSGLIGIISQRLVKELCPECKELKNILYCNEKLKTYKPKGCSKCGTGYIGMKLIIETLVVEKEIRELINNNASYYEIRNKAKTLNYLDLNNYLFEDLKSGKISFEEYSKLRIQI